ncbi:MAG: response regulator transcription factor [Silvibacterium sp.]
MATVRVFIVDDFEPWRRAVRSILGQDKGFEVIFESSEGLEAVRKSAELQPDLVLLDIGLPDLCGLEAARQIRKVSPGSRIIFLTSDGCPDLAQEALRIGALGFLIKSDAARDLLPAVTGVMRDEQFASSRFPCLDPTKPPHP